MRRKITLIYSKFNSVAVSDYDVGRMLKSLRDDSELRVSTANIVNIARLLHVKGIIFLKLVFEGETLEVNEYGVVLNCPKNFLSTDAQISSEILISAGKKRRAEKGNPNFPHAKY